MNSQLTGLNLLQNSNPYNLKRTTQYSLVLLTALMLLKAFIVPVVYIDFKLNQDYIARVLCINREKPELHCDGNCILMQKIKEAQQGDDQDKSQNTQRYVLEIVCDETFAFTFLNYYTPKEVFYEYEDDFSSNYLSYCFHPPRTV